MCIHNKRSDWIWIQNETNFIIIHKNNYETGSFKQLEMPPSKLIIEPLINLASFEARNKHKVATSSGIPIFPVRCNFFKFFV